MNNFDFSLIIACYKDAPHLFTNVQLLYHYFCSTQLAFEFIFVEDCSPDSTADEVKKCVAWLREQEVPVQAIYHTKNTGRGRAITDGLNIARGRAAGFIDIDLEHLMDGLLPMITKILAGNTDVLVGRRAIGRPWSRPVRWASSYVYRWIVHLFIDLPISDTECGLKVFNREKILPILARTSDPHWFWDTEIVHRAYRSGLRVSEHWIVFVEDSSKASTVRLWHDTWAYLKAIRNYRRELKPHAQN